MTDYIITEIRWVNCKIGLNFWDTEWKYRVLCVVLKLLRQEVSDSLELNNRSLIFKRQCSFLKSKAKSWLEKKS